jgi:hypothetical protein
MVMNLKDTIEHIHSRLDNVDGGCEAEVVGVFTPASNFSESTVTVKQVGHVVYVSGTIKVNTTISTGASIGTISGVDLDEAGYGLICSTSASTVRALLKEVNSDTITVSGGLSNGTTQLVNMTYIV